MRSYCLPVFCGIHHDVFAPSSPCFWKTSWPNKARKGNDVISFYYVFNSMWVVKFRFLLSQCPLFILFLPHLISSLPSLCFAFCLRRGWFSWWRILLLQHCSEPVTCEKTKFIACCSCKFARSQNNWLYSVLVFVFPALRAVKITTRRWKLLLLYFLLWFFAWASVSVCMVLCLQGNRTGFEQEQ